MARSFNLKAGPKAYLDIHFGHGIIAPIIRKGISKKFSSGIVGVKAVVFAKFIISRSSSHSAGRSPS
jgi:hypothetical protein